MLSPKANTNTKMEFPKKSEVPAANQFKAAEIVDVPRPKKGMKRVDSSEKPLNDFTPESS